MKISDNDIVVKIVKGVEGMSIYLNDHRIIGNKPWGGGEVKARLKETKEFFLEQIIKSLKADESDILFKKLLKNRPEYFKNIKEVIGTCETYEELIQKIKV